MVDYTKKTMGRIYLEEKEHNFTFRIHTRDFYGGRTIMTNIVDHVNQTRRMIMLLSKYLFPFLSLFLPFCILQWILNIMKDSTL